MSQSTNPTQVVRDHTFSKAALLGEPEAKLQTMLIRWRAAETPSLPIVDYFLLIHINVSPKKLLNYLEFLTSTLSDYAFSISLYLSALFKVRIIFIAQNFITAV